jgi:hypothetical protein
LSLQNIPIDLQSLRLIDFYLLFWQAQEHLFAVLHALTSLCKFLGPVATEKPRLTATTDSLAPFSSHAAEANAHRPNLRGKKKRENCKELADTMLPHHPPGIPAKPAGEAGVCGSNTC